MWGPWSENVTDAERLARLRTLRALAGVFAPKQKHFITALRMAETDTSWLATARAELDRVPPLFRRRMLANFMQMDRDRSLPAEEPHNPFDY